jgi:hypothetical protein
MTQHSASVGAPKREKGWRLVAYLVRQPLWLLGGIAAVGSFVFQALALHNGLLSVVQPVLVTELVFVLVLRRVWIRQDVARAAWAAVLVVCVALSVFLLMAEPTGGHPVPDAAEWVSAVSVFGGSIAVLAVLGRRGSPVRRAAVFAMAAAGSSARRALERVPAGAGHHRPVRRHHFERLAVRRAFHRQPGQDRHSGPGVRRHGHRGCRVVAYSAERSHPVRPGQHVTDAGGGAAVSSAVSLCALARRSHAHPRCGSE